MGRTPPSLLFLKLNSPSPLSSSSCSKCYKPLSIFVKFVGLVFPCFSCPGKSSTGPSTPDMSHQAWVERQCWQCWQMSRTWASNLSLQHKRAKVSFAKLISSLIPAPTDAWGYSSPETGLGIWLFELDEIPACQFLRPIKIPLNGSTTPISVPPAGHIPSLLFLQPTTLN